MLILILLLFTTLNSKNILLHIGEEYLLDAKNIKKLVITNSNIVKAKQENDKIILRAKTSGKSKIKIIKNNLSSQLLLLTVKGEISPELKSIYKLLITIAGIKIKFLQNNTVIKVYGYVNSSKDYNLVKKLSNEYKFIKSYVKLQNIENIEDKIISKLLDIGAYDINITKAAKIYFIEMSVRSEDIKEKITIYIRNSLKRAKLDIRIIPYQIDIDVKIVETTKDETKNYGLELPTSLSLNRHSIMSQIDLDAVLHFGQSKGTTRVLYNPSLSTNDGETAEFHAGGSIPIKLNSQFSSDIVWKNYGVMLKFTPNVVRNNIVKLDISSEFSSLAGSTKDNNIPSILTRKVNTIVTVKDGKAIIISGLIQKMFNHSTSGLPILSDIPILSSIFSSNNKSKTKTELLIIVTPRLRLQYDNRLIDQELDNLLIESLKHK